MNISNMFDIVDDDHDDRLDRSTTNYHHYRRQLIDDFQHRFNFNLRASDIEVEQEQEQTLFEEFHPSPEEDHLSQRLSQLSTTTNQGSMEDEEQQSMSEYSWTKNPCFDQMIQSLIESHSSSLDREALRQMAFSIHQLLSYKKLHHLWSMYLQAGTGQLHHGTEENHTHYWPKQVIATTEDHITQATCEARVHEQLQHYHQQWQSYEQQVQDQEEHQGWNSTIQQTIETWLEHYVLLFLQMKCDLAIALLQCNYRDQRLQEQWQQEQPSLTEDQIQTAHALYQAQIQLEQTKKNLFLHRQRLFYHQPPPSYDSLQISWPSYAGTSSLLRGRYVQLIQHTKTELMAIRLAALEGQIDQYQRTCQQCTNHLFQIYPKHQPSSKRCLPLIEQRVKIVTEKFQLLRHFYVGYYLSPHQCPERRVTRSVRVGFVTNLILDPILSPDLSSMLTEAQRMLLNRGPTYVAPCQLQAISSFQSIDTMVSRQYRPLQQQLNRVFDQYRRTTSLPQSMHLHKECQEEFRQLFSSIIPSTMRQRALEEQTFIQSMVQFLKNHQWLLRRTADPQNLFYLTTKTKFDEQCYAYLQAHQEDYEIVYPRMITQQPPNLRLKLEQQVSTFNSKLAQLLGQHHTPAKIYQKLQVKVSDMKFAYLYFLPELSFNRDKSISSCSVQPIISTYGSITWKLGQYLYRLLRPILASIIKRTMLVDECDLIHQLEHYAMEHRLHSTTFFATLHIDNFYTMYSNQSVIDILGYLLSNHLSNQKLQHLSIVAIERLIALVYDYTFVEYQEEIYHFHRGLPNTMPLSDLLLNLCLYHWQKTNFHDPRFQQELILRYYHQFFFTWNHSPDELQTYLHRIKDDHEQMQLEIVIGRSVPYLNVAIENRLGHFYTCLAHSSTLSRFLLPYVVGHPKNQYRHWFRSALIRLVQLCSDYHDFQRERLSLEITCLVHGYSLDFIETNVAQFYRYFDIEINRYRLNETIYLRLRRHLLSFHTEQCQQREFELQLDDQECLIRFYYLYDYGPYNQFKEKFFHLWSTYLKNHPELASPKKTKILLQAKHLFSLNTLLAQQKPLSLLLP